MIRAVLLDLYGTLVRGGGPRREVALREMARALGLDGTAFRIIFRDTSGSEETPGTPAERAMMQLGPALGRDRAHDLVSRAVEAATRDRVSLAAALGAMPEAKAQMSAKDIAALDAPEEYLGAAEVMRKALLG